MLGERTLDLFVADVLFKRLRENIGASFKGRIVQNKGSADGIVFFVFARVIRGGRDKEMWVTPGGHRASQSMNVTQGKHHESERDGVNGIRTHGNGLVLPERAT